MFFSQHFSFPLSVSFHHCSTLIHLPPTLYNVFLPVLQFSPVSIISPLLHTHSYIYHPRCIMFFIPVLQFSPFSIIPPFSPYPFIHLPPTLYFFSLSTSVFPYQYHSTIAPYSFIHLPPTLNNFFLPVLQFSLVSIIPPLLHTHSFISHTAVQCFSPSTSVFPCQYHSTIAPYPFIHQPHRCTMFFSQHFSFPLSVSFHHSSTPIHSSTTHAV